MNARTLFMLSSLVLAFTIGIAVGRYRVFPYPALEFAKKSFDDVVSQAAIAAGLKLTEHAAPSRYAGTGITKHQAAQSSPGLTLLSGFFEGRNELRLVAADGTIVNRWTPSFAAAFPDPTHLPASFRPAADVNVELHGALALPDGSVVFNFDGQGTVKLDRCGAVQWTVPLMTHHAVSMKEDGGFWIPSFRYVEQETRYPMLETPLLEPTVVDIGPDGSVRQELSLLDLFFKNGLGPVLFANGLEGMALANKHEHLGLPNDIVHLNDVEPLPSKMAGQFPGFTPGSLLMSLRDYNMVLVADPRTLAVKWYRIGPWIGQHDADFVEGGRISVFDNHNDGTELGTMSGGSRIVEVDPVTGHEQVRYGGRREQPFYTNVMGQHQRLTGNILITEARAGRVFEVTPSGEVVWEFINRVDEHAVNAVSGAMRYAPGYFTVNDWSCR